MGKAKKTRKFAQVKRMITKKDDRLKENKQRAEKIQKAKEKENNEGIVREVPQEPTQMFFTYNTALTPPYSVLIDTNFLSMTVRAKLPLLESLMDCLSATVRPMITSCVMAELEKLGPKYRLALQIARDPRWARLTCGHQGVYADDCIVDRCVKNRIFLVGTNDRALKARLRKIPGCPIISVGKGKYSVERLPDVPES